MTTPFTKAEHVKIARAYFDATTAYLPSGVAHLHHIVSLTHLTYACDCDELVDYSPRRVLRWLERRLCRLSHSGNHSVVLGMHTLKLHVEIYPYKGMTGITPFYVPELRLLVCGPKSEMLASTLCPPTDVTELFDPSIRVVPSDLNQGLQFTLQRLREARIAVRDDPPAPGVDPNLLDNWLALDLPTQPFVYGVGPDRCRVKSGDVSDLVTGTLFGSSPREAEQRHAGGEHDGDGGGRQ
jgi:hypothetical protein